MDDEKLISVMQSAAGITVIKKFTVTSTVPVRNYTLK